MTLWKCRLAVVDSKGTVARFAASSGWTRSLGVCHLDWLELSPGRHVCQFETDRAPVTQMQRISRRWPSLTFLLDYEDETHRIKGLAKAKSGEGEHCGIGY